jgi:DNA-binding NarL/FixJ family response regulator
MVKLFIIEDHEMIIVSGFKNIFRPSRDQIEIAGSAPNIHTALSASILASSDLIILDLWIPREDPVESVKMLRERHPGIPVIIYTSEELPIWQWKMMEAGVKGYVNKSCSREDLKLALMHVINGGTWFTGPMPEKDIEHKSQHKDESFQSVSPIEKQIIELLVHGEHLYEIAMKLNTTTAKIDKTLAGLRNKFKCQTTVELVKLLSDHTLI